MTVTKLELQAQPYYSPDTGKLKGKVEFTGLSGSMTIIIDQDKAGRILAILAEELVNTAQGVASMMVGQIVDQAAAQTVLEIGGSVQ